MPFKSKAQQGFMFAKHPEIAKRWADETPDMKDLPEHVKAKAHHTVAAHKDPIVRALAHHLLKRKG